MQWFHLFGGRTILINHRYLQFYYVTHIYPIESISTSVGMQDHSVYWMVLHSIFDTSVLLIIFLAIAMNIRNQHLSDE